MTRSTPATAEERRGTPPPPRGDRLLQLGASTYDAAAHTVEATLSLGVRVKRWFGIEELQIDPAAIDLSRVTAGQCKLLDTHNQWGALDGILGNVESARIEDGKLIGTLRFAQTANGQQAEAMVARGELTGVSIGYLVNTWQLVEFTDKQEEVWRAVAWQLLEVSLVSVPADPNAGVRSAAPKPGTQVAESGSEEEDDDMQTRSQPAGQPGSGSTPTPAAAPAAEPRTQPAAPVAPAPAAPPVAVQDAGEAARAAAEGERARARTIRDRTRAAGLPEEVADRLVSEGVAVAHVGDRLVDEIASRGGRGTSPAARILQDNADPVAIRGRMEIALAARATAQLPERSRIAMSEDARPYANFRVLDMFAELARARGERIDQRLPAGALYDAVVSCRSLSTSDFPLLLANAANKVLLSAYNLAQPTYRRIFSRKRFTDFKAHSFLRAGDFPNLLEKGETGEFKYGSMNESRQQLTLAEYGRIIRVSRRVLINDDMGALADLPMMAGRRVANFENATAFAQFAVNAGGGPTITEPHATTGVQTGVDLWHATHGNLAGAAAAIDITSVGIGRASMRKQTSLDGLKLNIAPAVLLTSPDKETIAQQFVSVNLAASQFSNVNPFAGRLEATADANLTGNAWYLFAEPGEAETFVYGYLEGQEGPRFATQDGFTTEGVDFKVALDFVAGAVDYRGSFKNAGA